jgi:hypothetical protein
VSISGKRFSSKQAFVIKEPAWLLDDEVVLRDFDGKVCKLNFDRFSPTSCELEFEKGFNPSFFVIIVEYAVAQFAQLKDKVFVHSSGFQMNNRPVVIPAWRHTGKTNLLLEALGAGATYIADDWTLLGGDGQALIIPKRLNLLHYNLDRLPSFGLVPPNILGVHRFLESNSETSVALSEKAKTELRNATRVRLAAEEAFPGSALGSLTTSVYCVANLRRSTNRNGPVTWENRDHLYSDVIASTLWFEHHHLFVAYEAHKGLGGASVDFLDKSRHSAKEIAARALSKIPVHLEASAQSQHDVVELAQDLIKFLTESE